MSRRVPTIPLAMNRRIAVTGGIACGKSTVALTLAEKGVAVLDTDDVAHRLEGSDSMLPARLASMFGNSVLAKDGSVDRKALADIVFSDKEKLRILNGAVHPLILDEVRRWLDRAGGDAAVLVPLLYETGFDRLLPFDCVIAVVSDRERQIERLEGRGLGREEAAKRIDAQLPNARKAELADYVICNNGSVAELRTRTEEVLKSIMLS